MKHDYMCPMRQSPGLENYVFPDLPGACYCGLITKVRIDTLDRAISAVEHLHDYEAPHDAHRDALWNAISALRAMQEK
jgi:hypothetical protein